MIIFFSRWNCSFALELLFRVLSAALVPEIISSNPQQVPPWAVLQALALAVRLVLAVALAVTDGLGVAAGLAQAAGRAVAAAAHQDFHLGSLDHLSNFCTCLKFFMILYMFVPLYDVVLQTSSTVIKNK